MKGPVVICSFRWPCVALNSISCSRMKSETFRNLGSVENEKKIRFFLRFTLSASLSFLDSAGYFQNGVCGK